MKYEDIIDISDTSSQVEESGLLYSESRYGGFTANVEIAGDDSLQYTYSFTEEELDAEVISAESSGYVSTETFKKQLESWGIAI